MLKSRQFLKIHHHFIINRLRCKLREINIPIENFFNIFPKKIHEFSEKKKRSENSNPMNISIYILYLYTLKSKLLNFL